MIEELITLNLPDSKSMMHSVNNILFVINVNELYRYHIYKYKINGKH